MKNTMRMNRMALSTFKGIGQFEKDVGVSKSYSELKKERAVEKDKAIKEDIKNINSKLGIISKGTSYKTVKAKKSFSSGFGSVVGYSRR